VWVAVSGDGAVVGLDATTGAMRSVAPGGDFPLNVAAQADGGSVWATDNDGGSVVRIGPPR
jgi:DNA-binding beta-propeller fold protein YncE